MGTEIINRVANSGLITIDLQDFRPKENILGFDIKDLLFNGLVLKEKEFRASLKNYDFEKYRNSIVALYCGVETIIPMWAFMLVCSYLKPFSSHVYFGNEELVLQKSILKNINSIDVDVYKDKKIIIKGCSNIALSEALYIAITQKLQNSVSSLMFGEACSAVPVYKNKKK